MQEQTILLDPQPFVGMKNVQKPLQMSHPPWNVEFQWLIGASMCIIRRYDKKCIMLATLTGCRFNKVFQLHKEATTTTTTTTTRASK